MITLHHLESSRSQRIAWLLEELAVPYEVKHYQRDAKTKLAPDALKTVHPLGKSPVITDGERTVAESGYIIRYLAATYGGQEWNPTPSDASWHDQEYWLHYGEGSLMPLLVMSLIFSKIPKSPMPFFVRPVAKGLCSKVISSYLAPQIKQHMTLIDHHLSSRTWFGGDILGVADIQMSFPLQALVANGQAKPYKHIARFVDQLQARPAYQQAEIQVGPLTFV